MAIELATAYISVLPSTNKLAPAIKQQLATVDRDAKAAGDKAGRTFGSRMAAGLKSLVGPAIGAAAGVGAVNFFKDAFAEASEAQKIGAQTAAVIKSTGGAANVTAKQVDTLSSALSAKAGIDDELIANGANILLTFKNVRNEAGKNNDVFNQATKLGLDMSVALGQDMKSSSIQLGKALNDPVKGITALSRVGVTFTEQQKKQIERMVESGDTLGAQKLILRELRSEFGGSAAAQATAADKAKVAWGNLKETVGTALLPVFNRFATFATEKIIPAVSGFIDGIKNGTGAGGRFADMVRQIVGVAKNVWGFLKRNKDVLIGLAAGALAAAAAFKAIMIVQAVTKWVKALTVMQLGLNAAMRANPIGVIVTILGALVAAFVIAYKKSDTFRRIVDKAWAAIKKAVNVAWNDVIKPALKAFWGFLKNTLWPLIQKLWKNVVKPVFKAIGAAIKFAWNNVIKPALKALWAYLSKVLWPAIRFLWKNVVKPVFKSIGSAIKSAWDDVVKPVLKALGGFIKNTLVPVIRKLWNDVVKPVWNSIGDKIRAVWNNFIKPAFSAIRNFIRDTLVPAFRNGVQKIGDIWEGLKKLAAKPINFLIGTVYNNGLRKMMNLIPGVNLKPATLVSWGSSSGGGGGLAAPGPGGGRFAKGGVIPGYTPGRDVHRFYSLTGGALSLSGGEAVMRPEWVRAVGGPRAIDRMNRAASSGRYRMRRVGDVGAFAGGGFISLQDVSRAQSFARAQVGKPYVWGGVGPGGFDCSGLMSAIANVLMGRYPHTRLGSTATFPWGGFVPGPGLFTIGSANPFPGSGVGHMAGTLGGMPVESYGGHGPSVSNRHAYSPGFRQHAHLGPGGAQYAQAKGGGGVFAFIGEIKDLLARVKGWIAKFTSFGEWGGLVKSIVNGVWGKIADFINGKIPFANPVPGSIFDSGGVLKPGHVAFNASRRPEAVFSHRQFRQFAQDRSLAGERVALTITNWDRGVGYITRVAEGTVAGDRAFQGTTRRMRAGAAA